jgi:hypothetical protein
MAGAAEVTVRVTPLVCGLFDAAASEMVTTAVYVPADRPATETDREMASVSPVEVPPAGETESQDAESARAYDSVPPPEFQTLRVCAAGFGPPWGAKKAKDAGERPIAGPGLTVSVTDAVCGLFDAAASVIVIVPVYVPAASPDRLTDTAMASVSPPEVPLAGEADSHVAESAMVYDSVPPPAFHTLNVWLDGSGPPWMPVNTNDAGLRPIAGAGLTVRVTEAVCGLLPAAASVAVIVAVYVPAESPATLTDSVMASVSPVEVPPVGESVSQAAESVNVYDSVPPSPFQMLKTWLAGFAPPCVAAKENAAGLNWMIGVAAGFMVSVTAAVWGLFVADASVTVMRLV